MIDQQSFQSFIIAFPPFLFALTVHELSHGYFALMLGDPTARDQGRLTLNPLSHLDLLGTLAFFIMKIGWAKPVPVNPAYFRNPRRDMIWVALAGPGANILLAIASAILSKGLLMAGSQIIPPVVFEPVLQMLVASIWINILLAVFNLLPIPPLDGSRVVHGLLPLELAATYKRLEPFGFILLLGLFYLGIIQKIIGPIIAAAFRMIT